MEIQQEFKLISIYSNRKRKDCGQRRRVLKKCSIDEGLTCLSLLHFEADATC